MTEIIKERIDLCTGCNRCVRECPMEAANVTYLDGLGNIKVKIDHEWCITCGWCISACKHDARYFVDDTDRFFSDLSKGTPISLIAAPAVKTNIPEYKRLFTYLKRLGVNKIYDVSLGADICVWAHIRHLKQNKDTNVITQPCPPIVNYCEIYRHDLIKKLSPVHSPMACASIYMKEYQGISDNIAALSPCMAKAVEFNATNLTQYNVTFTKLLEYLKTNGISLPDKETGFDHAESGLGSLFPMPGGFKENIEYLMGKNLHAAKAEGFHVYDKLDKYAETPEDFLPDIYDVLNCAEGCNIGNATLHDRCAFEIDKTMNDSKIKIAAEYKKEYYESIYKTYDATLDVSRFMREYRAIPSNLPQITGADIARVFESLGKNDYEKQHVDCFACGSETCYDMARKIALGVNIPENCIIKSKEDAKIEHEENLRAHAQLIEMEKMHEADELILLLFDSTPFSAHFWDEDLNMTDCNEAAAKMFGLSNKQEYVDRYFEFMPEFQPDGVRSADRLRELVSKTFEEGYQRAEFICMSSSGELIPVEETYVRVDYNGIRLVAGYSRDLREHKKMLQEIEAAGRENEFQLAVLNMVIKATNIGIWDMEVVQDDPINPKNRIVWSDEFRRMMGYENEIDFPNVLSMWGDRLHPEDAKKTADAILAHLNDKTGKTPYDHEFRIMKKNGEYAHLRASSATIRDENGNPLRAAGALLDMTEMKNLINEAESQRIEAQAANKAKSEFLSHISHEIRTPMNAILGTAEIQLQKGNLPDIEEAFNMVYNSGNLLLNIINDILDLSKIEAGKLELLPAQYDIPSIIYDTVQLNLLRYESKPIEFDLKIDADTPLDMFGDELRIKQILNNIISNAFKYTDKGKVELSVSAETKKEISGADPKEQTDCVLILTVRDTGQGMTEEQMDRLFEEYTRFNIEANRTIVGTGLGMHITKRLADVMDAEILVESEIGKGSVFTVRLPQKCVGSALCGAELAGRLRSSRFKNMVKLNRSQVVCEYMPYGSVLIVDDIESNLYVAKGMMLPYGLKIDTVSSGFDAVDKIKNGNKYDIIFMDHMMPKMNGMETTKILRSMGYSQPVVALTANAITGSSEMFLSNGFDGYMSKPIDMRELNASLNRLIRDKQPPEIIEASRKEVEQRKMAAVPELVRKVLTNEKLVAAVVRDIGNAISVLEDITSKINNSGEADIELYTTTIHGMKSALANIGETELSSAAFKLEQAGDKGEINIISAETPNFIRELMLLVKKFKPEQPKDSKNPEETADDKNMLREKLSDIIKACGKFNKKAAKTALDDLKASARTRAANDLLDEISVYLLRGEFKKVVEAAEKAIAQI